jgi:hypothetical protein
LAIPFRFVLFPLLHGFDELLRMPNSGDVSIGIWMPPFDFRQVIQPLSDVGVVVEENPDPAVVVIDEKGAFG